MTHGIESERKGASPDPEEADLEGRRCVSYARLGEPMPGPAGVRIVTKNYPGGWSSGLAVESTGCPYRGLGFCSTHIAAQIVTPVPGIQRPLLASIGTAYVGCTNLHAGTKHSYL